LETSKYDFLTTRAGFPHPYGANVINNGVQFSIFARNAESVTLVLFHSHDQDSPFTGIELDPVVNKTGDIWHIWIEGLGEGQVYGYRIDGDYDPDSGHRYNRNKLLIDPYSRALTGNYKWDLSKAWGVIPESDDQHRSFSGTDSAPFVPRSIVINSREDSIIHSVLVPENELIIYELHVKGFTAHESSGVFVPGTFLGLTEKIPYLKELGINAVELLPIQEFDEFENINVNPDTGEKLKNYWGYSTIAFFAPKSTYSSSGVSGEQVREFRQMVKRFKDEGIEVFLDVVFNHTHEGDHKGPTLSFRGIDNSIYYILDEDKAAYKNFSGCGNTFNCNHPIVRQFILDCLRYWVIEMGVDGFRFDLASILGRDRNGEMLSNPPLIEWIEEDPILRSAKIIAEAWDAGGAYQVGAFPGRWADWNGKYRDDVRRFWRGEAGFKGIFATRITGSSDIYGDSSPCRSINFITCHDGFTLNDLVSFNSKHNIQNGENNRDGENHNFSCNWGYEGLKAPDHVEAVRVRMIKNFTATLFLSLGIPMMLAGDEFRRTQRGNNNAYCQDNDISWVNWSFLENNREIYDFTQGIINFRKKHPLLKKGEFFTGKQSPGKSSEDIKWFNQEGVEPDWEDKDNIIALLMNGEYASGNKNNPDSDIYMMFNASNENIVFIIPPAPNGRPWKISINTSGSHGKDIFNRGGEPEVKGHFLTVSSHSLAVLTA
jgi:glycogen operon protein